MNNGISANTDEMGERDQGMETGKLSQAADLTLSCVQGPFPSSSSAISRRLKLSDQVGHNTACALQACSVRWLFPLQLRQRRELCCIV